MSDMETKLAELAWTLRQGVVDGSENAAVIASALDLVAGVSLEAEHVHNALRRIADPHDPFRGLYSDSQFAAKALERVAMRSPK